MRNSRTPTTMGRFSGRSSRRRRGGRSGWRSGFRLRRWPRSATSGWLRTADWRRSCSTTRKSQHHGSPWGATTIRPATARRGGTRWCSAGTGHRRRTSRGRMCRGWNWWTWGDPSRRVSHFDVETLAECGKCRLDLVQPGVMPERKQTIDMRLGYADPARELRFC